MYQSDTKKKVIRILESVFVILLFVSITVIEVIVGIDSQIKRGVADRIITEEEAAKLEDVDCIIVLGCLVHDDGSPSDMLEDRLKRGVALYNLGAAPKLLMSGDHGTEQYDEVDSMKHYAVDAGVASEDVFMDHAGFSTYESIYRAKEVFCADKVIIVSQEYHLYRALYIAEQLGVEANAVAADYRTYTGQRARDYREVLARLKDWAMSYFKPEPTYLGETIPISGNGELTHDDKSAF